MTKYIATFPTGKTVSTNSNRQPSTAWAVIDKDNKIISYGFSRDYKTASAAAKRRLPSEMPENYRSKKVCDIIEHSTRAQMKGFKSRKDWYAACRRKTQELRKGLKIIFANAKIEVDF